MENTWQKLVAQPLSEWAAQQGLTTDIQVGMVRSLSGSGFAQIHRLETNVGEFVVKQALVDAEDCPDDFPADQFRLEGLALQQLARQTAIRVPQVIAIPERPEDPLITQFLPKGNRPPNADQSFGQQLARMHQALATDDFGWTSHNYLGATVQSNQPGKDWPEFWTQQRMVPQLELAQRNGWSEIAGTGQQLLPAMHRFLAQQPAPRPTLIHGDLWSGNFWWDSDGQPCMIDPACYQADPLAELGMISLFGNLGPDFYQSYCDTMQCPRVSPVLLTIYRLYHVLNHLNLFGAAYQTQTQMELDFLKEHL